MRFMVIVKANEQTEAGRLPTTAELAEMGRYNEELVQAGVMLDGQGLLPSAQDGFRVHFSGDETSVVDGPFAETKELIAGYWIWEVSSKDEAVEWARRIPNLGGGESSVEIRRVATMDDFGDEFTPELREREAELEARIREQRGE